MGFLVLTVVATAYFGWHYLVDDIAGLAIGATAVAVADRATRGVPVHPDERPRLQPSAAPA